MELSPGIVPQPANFQIFILSLQILPQICQNKDMKYIIVDLEATCWEKRGNRRNEIIEIGAVCVDGKKSVLGEFDIIVKPILNPELSEFCTDLTTITQEMVDQSPEFPEALKAFKEWVNSFKDQYLLCSWGHYDRLQFVNDCKLHSLNTEWTNHHISLKHQYAEIKKLKGPVSMKNALKNEKIELTGTHHRGIDDVRNISKIFVRHFEKWNSLRR